MTARHTVVTASGDQHVVHLGRGDLSPRGRVLVALLATMLLVLGAGALTALGMTPITADRTAAGSGGATGTGPASAPLIPAQWDGPTVHLDWTGRSYATAEATFVGDRVVSPGDRVQRTLTLSNAGPSGAVLHVELAVGEDVPAGARNPELAEAVDLFWDVAGLTGSQPFAVLLDDDDHTVAEIEVPQGGTVAVTVGVQMSAAVTEHLAAGADSTVLDFQVTARMQGDEVPVDPTPAPTPSVSPAAGGQTNEAGSVRPAGALAVTGAQVLAVLVVAVGLVLLGWLLLVRRRRARCAECEHRVACPACSTGSGCPDRDGRRAAGHGA